MDNSRENRTSQEHTNLKKIEGEKNMSLIYFLLI